MMAGVGTTVGGIAVGGWGTSVGGGGTSVLVGSGGTTVAGSGTNVAVFLMFGVNVQAETNRSVRITRMPILGIRITFIATS